MRDPMRIQVLIDLLTEIWEKYPDLRFNQLIYSLQTEYCKNKKAYLEELWEKDEYQGIVSYRKKIVPDLFAVEDDDFIEFLKEEVKKIDE